MRSGNFIQKRHKLKAINRIVNAISSNGWFEHPQANRAWLRDYLSTLYDRGLVLHDELIACGIAAARHPACARRYAAPAARKMLATSIEARKAQPSGEASSGLNRPSLSSGLVTVRTVLVATLA